MQHFLTNFSICLFSLWLVYKLLLENTSWHQFKRFYLLAALVVSVVIPFVVVKTMVLRVKSFNPMPLPTFDQGAQVPLETIALDSSFTVDWSLVLLTVYAIGFIVMLLRFFKNLYGLRLKSTDQLDTFQNYRLILRSIVAVPHSFWNTIYVDIKEYQAGRIPLEVMEHEKAHLDQKHSIDILLIEILMVFAWFNPLIYIIKYCMRLNHEFLADKAVIQKGMDTKTYQETLLQYAARSQNRSLANTFNFPIIKKRFTIMKIHTTTASGLLRSLVVLPVLILLVVSCGKEESEIIYTTSNSQIAPLKVIGEQKEGNNKFAYADKLSKQEMDEYEQLTSFYNNYPKENFKNMVFGKYRMVALYHRMNDNQKKTVEKYLKSTTSYTIKIDNDGQFFDKNNNPISINEVEALLQSLTIEQKKNSFLFSDEDDYDQYKLIKNKPHPTQMIYIHAEAKQTKFTGESIFFESIAKSQGLDRVQYANDRPDLVGYLDEIKEMMIRADIPYIK